MRCIWHRGLTIIESTDRKYSCKAAESRSSSTRPLDRNAILVGAEKKTSAVGEAATWTRFCLTRLTKGPPWSAPAPWQARA